MAIVLRYRGRIVEDTDVGFIQSLIHAYPEASRRQLSKKLCAAWNWVQANGAPCDMVCRGLMLALDRAGHITLPPPKGRPPNPLAVRARPRCPEIDTSPMACGLKDLGPLEFRLVRRTRDEPVFNGLIEHYHYLHYTHEERISSRREPDPQRPQIKGRLLLSHAEKATLAEIAHRLGRKALDELAAVARPAT